uniref:phosphoinositide phospholipase C n=1 Tax=Dermatophagoides pteronyssinus TaxID=6956 RepID=A0A6P6XQV8_DERPT
MIITATDSKMSGKLNIFHNNNNNCQNENSSGKQISILNEKNLTSKKIYFGRITLGIIYEKYAIPNLNYWGLKELYKFFKKEEHETLSKEQCQKLFSVFTNGTTTKKNFLTKDDFFQLLHMQRFDIINPIHSKQCLNMKKSLVNYYVATCTILTIKPPVNGLDYLSPKYKNLFEQNLLDKYDRRLSLCRCFYLKLDWNEEQISVLVNNFDSKQEMIGITLETLLNHMSKHGFDKNPWPIILIFDCKNLIANNRMNDLIKTLCSTIPEQQIFNKSTSSSSSETNQLKCYFPTFLQNSNQTAWPSLRTLRRKFILIIKHSDSINTVLMNLQNNKADWVHSNESTNIDRLANDKCLALSLDSQLINDSIERDRKCIQDDSIAVLTCKTLTWNNNSLIESNVHHSIDLIRMGIQCLPYRIDENLDDNNDDQLCRSLFDTLNGSCGYVLKPSSLRNGQMYCIGISEDSSLPDEPSAGPIQFLLTLYCIEDLMQFDLCKNPMKCKVIVHIIGYYDDNIRYETETCNTKGQIPFWNKQIRPVIRLPNFTFIRFEVYNCDRLVANRTLPLKAIRRGIRYISLEGKNGHNNGGKLFVQCNFKKIAACWSPDFRSSDDQQQSIVDDDQKHQQQQKPFDHPNLDFIDSDTEFENQH